MYTRCHGENTAARSIDWGVGSTGWTDRKAPPVLRRKALRITVNSLAKSSDMSEAGGKNVIYVHDKDIKHFQLPYTLSHLGLEYREGSF